MDEIIFYVLLFEGTIYFFNTSGVNWKTLTKCFLKNYCLLATA